MPVISVATRSVDTSQRLLYTYSGFDAREIDPWYENGERWRVLQVTFPDGYAAHTRTQYSYFGEDGLLRRHLYTVDVLGGAQGANYASEVLRRGWRDATDATTRFWLR